MGLYMDRGFIQRVGDMGCLGEDRQGRGFMVCVACGRKTGREGGLWNKKETWMVGIQWGSSFSPAIWDDLDDNFMIFMHGR